MKLPLSPSPRSDDPPPERLTENLFISLLSMPIRLQGTFQLMSATRKREGVFSTRISDGFFKVKAMFTGKAANQLDSGNQNYTPPCILSGILRFHSDGVVIIKQSLRGWPCSVVIGAPKHWRWKKQNHNPQGQSQIDWKSHQENHKIHRPLKIEQDQSVEKERIKLQTQSLSVDRIKFKRNSTDSLQSSNRKLPFNQFEIKDKNGQDSDSSDEFFLSILKKRLIPPKETSPEPKKNQLRMNIMALLESNDSQSESNAEQTKEQSPSSPEFREITCKSRPMPRGHENMTVMRQSPNKMVKLESPTKILKNSYQNSSISSSSQLQISVNLIPFESVYHGVPLHSYQTHSRKHVSHPQMVILVKAIGPISLHPLKEKGMIARCIVGDQGGEYIMDALCIAPKIYQEGAKSQQILLRSDHGPSITIEQGRSYTIRNYEVKEIFSSSAKAKGSAFEFHFNIDKITIKDNLRFEKVNYYDLAPPTNFIESQSYFSPINKLSSVQIGMIINLYGVVISTRVTTLKSNKIMKCYEVTQPNHWQVIEVIQFLDEKKDQQEKTQFLDNSLITAFNLKLSSFKNNLVLNVIATTIIKLGYCPYIQNREEFEQYSSNSQKLRNVKLHYPSFVPTPSLSSALLSPLTSLNFYVADITLLSLKLKKYIACQLCLHKNEGQYCSICQGNTAKCSKQFMITTLSDTSTTTDVTWNDEAIKQMIGQRNQAEAQLEWNLSQVEIWVKRGKGKDGKNTLNGTRMRKMEVKQKCSKLIDLLKNYV